MKKYKSTDDMFKDVINFMLKKHNVDFDYVKENPEINGIPWYQYYTHTQKENDEVKEYFIKVCKKYTKCQQRTAETQWSWFNLMWGLKVVNE